MRLLGDALSPPVVVARRVDVRRQFDFSAVRFRYRRWNQELSGKLFELLVNVGFRRVPDFRHAMDGANDIQLCCHLTSLNDKRSKSNSGRRWSNLRASGGDIPLSNGSFHLQSASRSWDADYSKAKYEPFMSPRF